MMKNLQLFFFFLCVKNNYGNCQTDLKKIR